MSTQLKLLHSSRDGEQIELVLATDKGVVRRAPISRLQALALIRDLAATLSLDEK